MLQLISYVIYVFPQARIWAASIGFSLLFGPMLAKAIRVYFVVTRSEKDLKQRVCFNIVFLFYKMCC